MKTVQRLRRQPNGKPRESVTAAAVVRVDRCMLAAGECVRIKFLSLPVVGLRLKPATRQFCSGDFTIVSGMAHGIHPHISNFLCQVTVTKFFRARIQFQFHIIKLLTKARSATT